MKELLNDCRGFTLPELLVTMGILSLVMLIAFNFLKTSYQMDRSLKAMMDLQASTRQSMDMIRQDLRNAVQVQTPADSGSTQTSGSSLRFVDGNNNDIEYRIDNGRLVKQNRTAGTTVSTSRYTSVQNSVSFKRLNNMITVELNGNKSNKSISMRTKIYLQRIVAQNQ